MEFLFILVIHVVVCGCFVSIVETQTLSETLTTKGSIGHFIMVHAIFEDQLNWFEARQTCIDEGYDDLDDAAYTDIRYDGVEQKLLEEQVSFNKMWVFFHRISASSADWYETGCVVTDRVGSEAGTRPNHRCIGVDYDGDNVFEHHDRRCSETWEFICTKFIGLSEFSLYDMSAIDGTPPDCTRSVTNESSSGLCIANCDFNMYCIAYMFDSINNQCELIILNVGKAWAYVNVTGTNNPTTAVGVRVGMLVTLRPSMISVSPLVPSIFPCELSSTSSMSSTLPTTPTVLTSSKTSTVTSTTSLQTPPGPSSSHLQTNLTINVTGFSGSHFSTRYSVVLQEATWYEAELMCKQNQLGSLGRAYPSKKCHSSSISSILNETNTYPNVSLWVRAFRHSPTSTDWYSGNYYFTECDLLNENIADLGGQCVYAVFREYGQDPELYSANCNTTLPLLCTKNTGANTTNFTSYPGYDLTVLPNKTSFTRKDVSSEKNCVQACRDLCECIGVSYYPNITDGCWPLLIEFGIQYLDYQLSIANQNVTHFVKIGIKGTVYPVSSMNVPENVPETLPTCPTTTTTFTHPQSDTSSTRTIHTTSTSQPQNICQCPTGSSHCDISGKHTESSLEEAVERLAKKLRVEKTATSAHKRRLVSAKDERASSKTIGGMAIAFMSLCAAVIVVPDAICLLSGVKSMLSSTIV